MVSFEYRTVITSHVCWLFTLTMFMKLRKKYGLTLLILVCKAGNLPYSRKSIDKRNKAIRNYMKKSNHTTSFVYSSKFCNLWGREIESRLYLVFLALKITSKLIFLSLYFFIAVVWYKTANIVNFLHDYKQKNKLDGTKFKPTTFVSVLDRLFTSQISNFSCWFHLSIGLKLDKIRVASSNFRRGLRRFLVLRYDQVASYLRLPL